MFFCQDQDRNQICCFKIKTPSKTQSPSFAMRPIGLRWFPFP